MSLDFPPLPSAEPAQAGDGRIALNASLLKNLRKGRGLSQEALAELCFNSQLAVSIASIKRAETGKVVLYRTARHLATIFDVELEALIEQPGAAGGDIAPGEADEVEDSLVRYVIELAIALPGADGDALADIAHHVAQFGGRMEAAANEQVIAIFGVPQAYGSDAERSMRCAIELARTLVVYGARAMALRLVRWEDGRARASEGGGPDLRERSGRLTAAVPIYVERNLLGQLSGRFAFDDAGERIAGYAVYAGALADERAQLPALIGRYSETRQFKALTESVLEAQGAHVVYLRAAAGVGKTRLSIELADIARQAGFACHRCEVQDAGADSWRTPLGQLARSLLRVSPDAAASIEQAIADTVGELHLPPETILFYRHLTGARMNSEQMSLHAAMSHTVRDQGIAQAMQMLVMRLAIREPLLITIEDVHWADSWLLDALGALMSMTREAPVLWVLTSRIDHDPLEAALRSHLFEMPLSLFELAPLAPREALALADQYADVEPSYRQRCVERAQGNALFLTQLLATPEQALPASLKHLIQTRLDAFPPVHRRALRTAAVIGNRFELSMLREAIGEADYEPETAGRNSLVRRIAPGVWAFVHDLVMHCIVDSIEESQLRRLHRTIAALYREYDPALSAQHLYRAGDPGAFDMMLRAIRDKLANHEYETALELTAECSANDSTRFSSFTLALLQSHATAGLGQMGQARRCYEQALMLAGRPQEKIDAVIGLATSLNILEELDEEERLIDETVPLAHSINAEASLAKLLYLKGNIYFPRGDFSECRRHHEQAVRHAQNSGMTETLARALSGVGDSYYAQGRMKKAHDVFSQCIAMCEQHRFLAIEASNRSALGSTSIYLGQPEAAVRDALRSAELARKVGNRRAEIFSRMTAGWVLVATAQLGAAREEVGHALSITRSMGAARFEPFLMESQARIAWLSGDEDEGERLIVAANDTVQRQRLQRFIGPWVLGTLAVFTSDAAVRKKALLQGAAQLTRDCLAHNAYRFYVAAAEVALLEQDLVSAAFYAEQLGAYAASEPCAWVDHHVALVAHMSNWISDPNEAVRAALVQLRGDAQRYGFAHTAPKLARLLQAL